MTHFQTCAQQPAATLCGAAAEHPHHVTADPQEVTCDDCHAEMEYAQMAAEAPERGEPDAIAALREAVAERASVKIRGVLVDMQSANVVVLIYDALTKPETKRKFAALPTLAMVQAAWTLYGKAKRH